MFARTLRRLIARPRINTTQGWRTVHKTTTNHCYLVATNSDPPPHARRFLIYSPEESDKIVNIINNSDLENLLRYEISKVRALKIKSWISKNGPLQSPEDMLEIDGLSVKILHKFCSSLLVDQPQDAKSVGNLLRQKTVPFVTPSMISDQRLQIRSCVAVRIAVSSVSWARLEVSTEEENSPCLLTHWHHHDITDKKLHISDLAQRCLYIDHLIPEADCYVLESPQVAQAINNPGNADQQNINIQKSQILAVLSFALSARQQIIQQQKQQKIRQTDKEDKEEQQQLRESDEEQRQKLVESQQKGLSSERKEPLPNVFFLRRFLTARLFNHLVGNERVSSEKTILNLMRTYYNVPGQQDYQLGNTIEESPLSTKPSQDEKVSFRRNVQFPPELRKLYSKSERFRREFLGQALLLNLAFVRLVLLEDTESIRKVATNPKKKSNEDS